ncbi:MAG: hypothetical protein A4E61_00482 [Syntrophorhabdus sp. PtaB.Bin184]|nr:MAG: hypothetical protein A4E61_00482 [Syntrophorhabdus sp. PtaB.Bin184]
MKKLLLVMILVTVSLAAGAQAKWTFSTVNGEWWGTLDESDKIYYVIGSAASLKGIIAFMEYVQKDGNNDVSWALAYMETAYEKTFKVGRTVSTIVSMLNDFYRNPDNMDVPLMMAIYTIGLSE